MSEKLCLQWNDFKENAPSAFRILREDNDFADVTLACEDGEQFEAHKVILASSSPFFQNILRRNKQAAHPLIYMRGMKSEDLVAIIDFLYCGEANVFNENLDSFLAIAEELQLKGLMGKLDADELGQKETPKKRKVKVHKNESNTPNYSTEPNQTNQVAFTKHDTSVGTLALVSNFSGDLKELDNKSNSLMVNTLERNVRGNPIYKCTLCGKEAENSNLKKHIEANHLEGISVPCNLCEKTFRTRYSLAVHKHSYHRGNISP